MFQRGVLAALLLGLTCSSTALAQGAIPDEATRPSEDDSRARTLFHAATAQFGAEQYEEALELFSQAYELSGRTALLFNVGLAAERVGDQETAIQAYERYLRDDPEGERREEVERRVRTLRADRDRRAVLEIGTDVDHVDDATPSAGTSADDRRPRWYRKWWVWTIASVVVAGTAVGIAAGTRGGGGSADPVAPNSGIDILALRRSSP